MAKSLTKADKLLMRLTPNTCEICPAFFALPRCFVDGYFPSGTFTLSELRRIIHLNFTRHNDFGKTWSGHKNFEKLFGYIKSEDYKRIEQSLVTSGFIAVERIRGTTTTYSVLVPPMYDKTCNCLISLTPGEVFNGNAMNNFIKVPTDIITNGILSKRYAQGELDLNEALLLLKLYRHNDLSAFGGVDYNLINIWDGQMFVNNTAFKDIGQTKEEFNISLSGLLNRKLVSFVEVDADMFVLDKGLELLCFASDAALNLGNTDSRKLMILRPYYQPPPTEVGKRTKRT
jgi:hypothetical protein